MKANKVEDNPVYQDQVRKRKIMLCAAFAAAACSTGVMFGLAKDSPDKTVAAGMVVLWGGYLASPMGRRKILKSGTSVIRDSAKPYGPMHPYQVLVTDSLKGYKKYEDAKIYQSDHKTMIYAAAFTDIKDIYFGKAFEEAVNNEEQMKAIAAHEVGHLQDSNRSRSLNSLSFNLAGTAGFAVPALLLFTPVTMPVFLASLAVSTGAMVATRFASQYVSRRGEHIADIRAMYNTGSKTIVQDAILQSFTIGKQVLVEHQDRENADRLKNGKPPFPKLKLLDVDYSSRFTTHPNPGERRKVMDEAAKYMP